MAIDVSNTPDGYTINVSGSFTFNTTCGVRAEPDMSATALAAYHAGDTVYYTSKLKSGNHFWLSYASYSGDIRYVLNS